MTDRELRDAISGCLAALTAAIEAPTPPHAPAALQELFRVLTTAEATHERAEAEDLIWAVWYGHEDPVLERRMNLAIGALARRNLDAAETLLDDLVRDVPAWPEAWNKRATLYFLQQRDSASLHDIRRTLELEPRHFGAMSGFGQICLRAGDEASALQAFQAALAVNPNLDGVRESLALIAPRAGHTIH